MAGAGNVFTSGSRCIGFGFAGHGTVVDITFIAEAIGGVVAGHEAETVLGAFLACTGICDV